jgi:demethylmenaquinone methyltransferase/2-methoxy-6-polyprenyl-1,4-benzoquinol methylase
MPALNYSPAHVIGLFDDMAKTYGAVNLLSSLGFSHLWRKACIRELSPQSHHHCADLMCGMGEATTIMAKVAGNPRSIDAIDFCPEMIKRCHRTISRYRIVGVSVYTRDVFDLPSVPTYDRICCSFGLKTLSDEQLQHFARLIRASLKPSGRASFVEIHVPENTLLRLGYLFYIRHVIPAIGRLCLGNPNCYRYLALYTEDYAKRDFLDEYLRQVGLVVSTHTLFFGCAKLYVADLA